MKKIYMLLAVLGMMNVSLAQQKTTGVKTLGGVMTVKIDLNQATSVVTLTLTGPSDRWFSVGFNATSMATNTDCVVMTSATVFNDERLPGGHNAPVADATNNWAVTNNTVIGSTRTIIATRAFSTGDTNDFTFDYAASSINLIWAYANSATYSLNDHGSNFGSLNATYSVLGVEDFATLDNISIYPNPSNGILNINKNSLVQISKIRIFDSRANLLKEMNADNENQFSSINLSELSKGIYFMEISNNEDKVIKKFLKN